MKYLFRLVTAAAATRAAEPRGLGRRELLFSNFRRRLNNSFGGNFENLLCRSIFATMRAMDFQREDGSKLGPARLASMNLHFAAVAAVVVGLVVDDVSHHKSGAYRRKHFG